MGVVTTILGSAWSYISGVQPAKEAVLNACNNFSNNPTQANQQAVYDAYANYMGSGVGVVTKLIPDPVLIRPMVDGLSKSVINEMAQQGIPSDALRAMDQQFGSSLEGQQARNQCEQVLGDKFRSDLSSKINQLESSIAASSTYRIVYLESPLALDLDGDGVETVAANGYAGAMFDHNADGIRTATGWINSDDGLLVRDIDGNGTIDNGRELFGDNTGLTSGQLAANGFAALADMDSNGDHVINNQDANFAQLQIWRDLNQNGVSDAGELYTLAQLGIQSINTTAHDTTSTTVAGGVQTGVGSYTRTDNTVGAMADIYVREPLRLFISSFPRKRGNEPLAASFEGRSSSFFKQLDSRLRGNDVRGMVRAGEAANDGWRRAA